MIRVIMACHFRIGLLGAALLLVPTSTAWANLPLQPAPTNIDFAGFDGSGLVPAPGAGQLDSDEWVVRGVSDGDLAFGGDGSAGDYARGASSGGEAEGGVWAFDVGASVALGANPTMDDFTPGSFVLRLVNETGQTIESIDLAYVVWRNNNGNRSNTTAFAWSTDDSAYTTLGALGFTTPAAADGDGWINVDQSTTIGGLSIEDGENLYLRWSFDAAGGAGDHDEFAIDDIEITVLDVCGNGISEDGEACDDGNPSNTDACVDGCVAATCGDGFTRAGVEGCDDGNADNTDACPDGASGTCQPATCGDGFTQNGVEDCDDANKDDTDACVSGCDDASCGDGFLQSGVEDCDDGNMDNGDECPDGASGTCEAAVCGDGFTQGGVEECDDGNKDDTDDCANDCTSNGPVTTTTSETETMSSSTDPSTTDPDATAGPGSESGTSVPTSTDDSSGGSSSTDPTDSTTSTTTPATSTDTITSDTSDTDGGGFDGEDPPGCGCRSGGGGAWLLPAFVVLALPRRRWARARARRSETR
jgi:hypothetical protein